jgi:hypothetical protein
LITENLDDIQQVPDFAERRVVYVGGSLMD